MKFLSKLLIWVAALGIAKNTSAQSGYTVQSAHSHNDYMQSAPFTHAYGAGFGAIEADIFLKDGHLLVAHELKSISPNRTLKGMYIDPIKESLKKDTGRRLTLLIDIKEDYWYEMPVLLDELKPLRKYCKTDKKDGRLLILISGNRPPPTEFGNYPDYIFFDEDLRHTYTPEQLKKIGQISLQYSLYSKWKGVGAIPAKDEQRIKHVIDSVHTLGKPIRFWDAPDNRAGWSSLIKLKADIIGTDLIDELSAYLKQ